MQRILWLGTRPRRLARRLGIVLFASLAAASCNQEPRRETARPRLTIVQERIPLGPLQRSVVPVRYRIALTIDPTKTSFSGHVEIDVRLTEKKHAIFLHGRDLNMLGASVRLSARKSVPAHYVQVDKSGVGRLIFVDEIPAGKATLVLDYEAPFGKSLSGLYKVVDRGDAYAFTQFESISARKAFPCFDEPGFKTPFQLTVKAPSGDKVVSNTPIQSASRENGSVTTAFDWTKPLPTYLIALAVGPLDIVDGGDIASNQYRSRPIHLRGITARGNGPRIRYALSLTPKIVAALENYFGVAYPFQKLDLLAVPDFAAGAMENAGAITFRERLLLLDSNASVGQKRSSLSVQAHEITHQWFGDLVTPAWWDDIWLNESFADWMEYKIAQQVAPEEEFDTETLRGGLQVMDLDELPSARQIHQLVNGPDDIENAFDSITYDKGAAVLAMYESFLGENVFRRGIHAYLTAFAHRNAMAKDFIGVISTTAAQQRQGEPESVTVAIDNTGRITWNGHAAASMAAVIDQMTHMREGVSASQIADSFGGFIGQSGIPNLQFRMQCGDSVPLTHVTQQPYVALGGRSPLRQWRVPVCLSGAGDEKICRLVDRRSTDILLGAACPSSLMPNAEGKGYYRFALPEGEWRGLIDRAAQMEPPDQIALVYNAGAALGAGSAQADDLLAAVAATGPNARWDVLDAIDDVLHRLRLRAVGTADLAAYRAYVRRIFEPRLSDVGLTANAQETPEKALARERLATLLVSEARDPDTIAMLTKAGHAYLAGDSASLPSELVGEAMRAGLLGEGKSFAALLVKAFATSDQEFFRRQLVYAFAGSDDPETIKPLLALALTPKMRTGELRYLFEYMSEEPVARVTLWNWYKANYPALLARVSRDGMRRAVGTLATACDAASKSDVGTFFAPKTKLLTGTARPLALTEEKIDRCIAFRKAKGREVATALRAATH